MSWLQNAQSPRLSRRAARPVAGSRGGRSLLAGTGGYLVLVRGIAMNGTCLLVQMPGVVAIAKIQGHPQRQERPGCAGDAPADRAQAIALLPCPFQSLL